MTNAQAFDTAFMRVEPRGEGFAFVTVGKVKYLVSDHYCPFCKWVGKVGDGEPWCQHKEAAFGNGFDDDAADLLDTYRVGLYG